MTVKPVQPGSTRWRELVRIAIEKEADRSWFLGKAAEEVAPTGRDGVNNRSTPNLAKFAEDVGVALGTIMEYRRVYHAWPPTRRLVGVSWSVHQELVDHQDLIRDGMTVDEARRARGLKPTRTGDPAPPTERARKVREFLADPEVLREVVQDKDIVHAVERGHIKHLQEKMEEGGYRVSPQWYDEEHSQGPSAIGHLGSAVSEAKQARRELRDSALDQGERTDAHGLAKTLGLISAEIMGMVSDDMDDALAQLLAAGAPDDTEGR